MLYAITGAQKWSDIMISRYMIKFICLEDGNVKGNGGVELHGLIFHILNKINTEFATRIHEYKEKPFAIGNLNGELTRNKGIASLKKEKVYSFVLTGLTREFSNYIDSIIVYLYKEPFVLGTAKCSFIDANIESMSYKKLINASPKLDKVEVAFISPSCFKRLGMYSLFPTPELLLQGLKERFNLFSGIMLPEFNDAEIFIAKYNLKTIAVNFGKHHIIGFIGDCSYVVSPTANEEIKKQLGIYLNFAKFAGIGYKTTMGMGQIQFKSKGM